jgi:hypothetical protein
MWRGKMISLQTIRQSIGQDERKLARSLAVVRF